MYLLCKVCKYYENMDLIVALILLFLPLEHIPAGMREDNVFTSVWPFTGGGGGGSQSPSFFPRSLVPGPFLRGTPVLARGDWTGGTPPGWD